VAEEPKSYDGEKAWSFIIHFPVSSLGTVILYRFFTKSIILNTVFVQQHMSPISQCYKTLA
jgi:hypothetical protein